MSTKATISIGNAWHLYEDVVDQMIWIKVEGYPFEATHRAVSVQLPSELITAIRQFAEQRKI